MLNRVLFVIQRQAENMRPPKVTALISITDANGRPAVFQKNWSHLLRVSFDDVDPLTFPGQDKHLQEITAAQVADIREFVASHYNECRRIVVHCKHGISRSSAVPRAIAEVAKVNFPASYEEYNHFIY
jgi:predicted protein tyrosine phosphatase